jgi:hypothetical protein
MIRVSSALNSELTVFNWVYLHGDLEDLAGYDLLTNPQLVIPDGIHPCVFVHEGQYYRSRLYIWQPDNFPYQKGLVVAASDKAGNTYAQDCYEKRQFSL